MGTVRNNINIEGLSLEEELPKENNGQLITYSETDKLYIPVSNPEAKGIYEISIELDIVSKRAINTGLGKIIVLDGLKKYKILYIENNEASSASILYLELPYNTFIEQSKYTGNISEMNIHILDAYFYLMDTRSIYEHLVYQLDIHQDQKNVKKNEKNLIDGDSFDKSLIKKLKNVSNILNEAALSKDSIEEEWDNITISYRNINDVFM